MINNKVKIPVLAISVDEDSKNNDDFKVYNEKTFVENILCDENDLVKHTSCAHVIIRIVDDLLYPVYAKWYLIKVNEEVINGEEGFSINLCLAGEFDVFSFDIEFEFDKELNMEIPKYIIVKDISKKSIF